MFAKREEKNTLSKETSLVREDKRRLSLERLQCHIDDIALNAIRTDLFAIEFPDEFERRVYKARPNDGLNFNGEKILKMQLLLTHSPSVRYSPYCLSITIDNGNKYVRTVDIDKINKLYELFDAIEAINDLVAVGANDSVLSDRHWSSNYSDQFPEEDTDKHYDLIRNEIKKQAIKFIGDHNVKSVVFLEIGCGHMNLLLQCVEECIKISVKVEFAIGVDLNQASIGRASGKINGFKKVEQYSGVDISAICANSGSLPERVIEKIKKSKTDSQATKFIILSSGAMNRRVIPDVDTAINILSHLSALPVDAFFLSGYTEALVNSTVAKRANFKLQNYFSFSTENPGKEKKDEKAVIYLVKQTEEEKKHYQEKFSSFGGNLSSIKKEKDSILSLTPRFFSRLMPSREKQFNEIKKSIENSKRFFSSPLPREKLIKEGFGAKCVSPSRFTNEMKDGGMYYDYQTIFDDGDEHGSVLELNSRYVIRIDSTKKDIITVHLKEDLEKGVVSAVECAKVKLNDQNHIEIYMNREVSFRLGK
jgi:hypothetical protein